MIGPLNVSFFLPSNLVCIKWVFFMLVTQSNFDKKWTDSRLSLTVKLTECIAEKRSCNQTHGKRALWHAWQAGRRDPCHHRRAAALPRAESRTAFDSRTRRCASPESRRTETAGAIPICAFSLRGNLTDHETQNSNSFCSDWLCPVKSESVVQRSSAGVIVSFSLCVSLYSNGLCGLWGSISELNN